MCVRHLSSKYPRFFFVYLVAGTAKINAPPTRLVPIRLATVFSSFISHSSQISEMVTTYSHTVSYPSLCHGHVRGFVVWCRKKICGI